MIKGLLEHPPTPEGHAAWIARVRELTEIAGDRPDDEAGRVPGRAKMYYVLEGDLFRQHPNGVGLRYVTPEEGAELLKDIHQSDCGHHPSPRALAGKALRRGLCWPTASENAAKPDETCGDHRPFCDYHQVHSHATKDCLQRKKLRGERLARNGQTGPSRSNRRRGSGLGSDSWRRGHQGETYPYTYGGGFNDVYNGGGFNDVYYGGGFNDTYYSGGYGGYYQLQPQQLQQPYFPPPLQQHQWCAAQANTIAPSQGGANPQIGRAHV